MTSNRQNRTESSDMEVVSALFKEIRQLAAELVEAIPDSQIEARLRHVLGPDYRRPEADPTENGVLVRPYVVTNGRTRPASDGFDPNSVVIATTQPMDLLKPEHVTILRFCKTPSTVMQIRERLDLPIDVVRVLLHDLLEMGAITVASSDSVARMSEWRSSIGAKNSRAQINNILLPKCAER